MAHGHVVGHNDDWAKHYEVCMSKSTGTMVVAPQDLGDFAVPKRIHESRFCMTSVFATVPLVSQTR